MHWILVFLFTSGVFPKIFQGFEQSRYISNVFLPNRYWCSSLVYSMHNKRSSQWTYQFILFRSLHLFHSLYHAAHTKQIRTKQITEQITFCVLLVNYVICSLVREGTSGEKLSVCFLEKWHWGWGHRAQYVTKWTECCSSSQSSPVRTAGLIIFRRSVRLFTQLIQLRKRNKIAALTEQMVFDAVVVIPEGLSDTEAFCLATCVSISFWPIDRCDTCELFFFQTEKLTERCNKCRSPQAARYSGKHQQGSFYHRKLFTTGCSQMVLCRRLGPANVTAVTVLLLSTWRTQRKRGCAHCTPHFCRGLNGAQGTDGRTHFVLMVMAKNLRKRTGVFMHISNDNTIPWP